LMFFIGLFLLPESFTSLLQRIVELEAILLNDFDPRKV